MIPNPKAFVNFLYELANIISHFEKPQIYQASEDENGHHFCQKVRKYWYSAFERNVSEPDAQE